MSTRKPNLGAKRASAVKTRKVKYLYKPRIVEGNVTVLAGDGGLGKSALMLDLVARLSAGAAWPNETRRQKPAEARYCSGEDDDATTLVPRLKVARANLDRIHLADALQGETGLEGEAFYLDTHAGILDDYLAAHPAIKLVVIDPLSAFVATTDLNKTVQVRQLLRVLRDIARTRKVAIVLIEHLNKPQRSIMESGRAAYRVAGAVALVNAARSVLMVELDPHEKDRRLLLPAKQNLAAPAPGLAFYIQDADGVAEVVWDREVVTWTADKLLTKVEKAQQLLREETADGSADAATTRHKAKRLGISPSTLKRARRREGIRSEPTHDGLRFNGAVYTSSYPPSLVGPVGPLAKNKKTKKTKGTGGSKDTNRRLP